MSASNTSTAAAVNNINFSTVMFIQVWCISVFILGTVGQFLNIYVFTRPRFLSNPCGRYFLASTFGACSVLYSTFPLRLLQTAYNIDIFVYSLPTCQILSYLLNCFRVLASWFIALASVDRFLCSSTSAALRKWSSIRVASCAIPITTLFISLAYIHIPFNFAILLPQRSCNFVSSTYRGFFSIWNLVFLSWIPSISMLIFGLLTIRHIRQGRIRVAPQNNFEQNNKKKIDRQLIQMLIFQSVIFGSTTTVYSICNLYISITSNTTEISSLDKAKYNYLATITNWISVIGPCLSFYLFTLSSKLFRNELISLFKRIRPTQRRINLNSNTGQTGN